MENKAYLDEETRSEEKQNGRSSPKIIKEFEKGPDPDAASEDAARAPLLFSSRLALSIISCLGFMNLYALRVNLSVSMVCMVNQTAVLEMKEREVNGSKVDESNLRPPTCMGLSDNSTNSTLDDGDLKTGEFPWPKEIQGLLLGSFFWGYLTTQVIGGWLSERFGGKRIYGWFMFVCAGVTLLMPEAARWDYRALLTLRFIAGVCQGVVWPAMSVLWARWAPPLERGKLCGLCYAGSQIGNVVTFPFAAMLCEYGFDGGWPSIFYVLGGLGLLWFVAWMFIVYDSPEDHPRTSEAEKAYISDCLRGNISIAMEKHEATPWLAIVTSTRVWAIVVTHTCANWGTYTFLTNIPTYLREVLYFDVEKNGLLSALPYIGFFLVINISGSLYDAVMAKNLFPRTMARKIGNTLGVLLPGLFVLAVGYMDCTRPVGAVTLLVIGVSMSGFQYGAGFLTNPADIAPQYTGIIFGISNTFATLPGFIAPTVIGYITTDQTQSQWQTVFFISAGIYAFGALFFVIFASGEIQEWAMEPDKDDPVTEKPFFQSSTDDVLKDEKTESRL